VCVANRIKQFARLAVTLGCYYAALSTAMDDNHIDAAEAVLQIVLAFAALIDIHSLPGNELDGIYELQKHCIGVRGLLHKPSNDVHIIRAGCREAISHLFYLLEMDSIPLATMVEALCPIEEESWTEEPWATITTTCLNC